MYIVIVKLLKSIPAPNEKCCVVQPTGKKKKDVQKKNKHGITYYRPSTSEDSNPKSSGILLLIALDFGLGPLRVSSCSGYSAVVDVSHWQIYSHKLSYFMARALQNRKRKRSAMD